MNRVTRRHFLRGSLALAGLGLIAGCQLGPLPGQARSTSPRRVGYLEAGTTVPTDESFRAGLRELGYLDGQNIIIEYRNGAGGAERLSALAAELVGLPVGAIVTSGVLATVAATQASSTIPIVASNGNIVAAGLVTNIAHPEGNITGVSSNSVEVVGKWIELLKETVPAMSRLAAVIDLSGPFLPVLQRAAQALQLQLTTHDLRDITQLSAVLETVKPEEADGVVLVSSAALGASANPLIGGEALKSGLPAVAESPSFARNGGLLAHGPNQDALARRSAAYVDKILKALSQVTCQLSYLLCSTSW